MRRIAVIATAMLAVVLPTAAQAQNPIEIGVDGALSTTLSSPHITNLSIPVSRLRVGFFTSPRVSIEPFGSLNYGHVEGMTFTNVNLGVGALYHFGAARSAPRIGRGVEDIARPGQGGGVGRVLLIPSFDQHHPDVEGECGDDEQRQQPAGEQDEDLATLGRSISC